MSPVPMSLSVVVPCFDEERRIGASLERLVDVLSMLALPAWEVLVVDDQSTDRTAAIVKMWAAKYPQVFLASAEGGKGKGAAVRTGALLARFDAVLIVDADLAGDLGHVPRMCERLELVDAVVGSRLLPGAIVEPARTLGRRAAALVFRAAVRLMTPLRVSDPQCGFKAFRRDVVQAQISHLRTNGYAYEIELLLRLANAGAVIEEIPVSWHEGRGSKVRVVRDGLGMLTEVWSARRHAGQAG